MKEFRIRTKPVPHVILLMMALGLVAVSYWGVFWSEDAQPPGTTAYTIVTVMSVIGAVILYFSLKIIITRPDIIRINEKGFEYNPSGVSSGFIEWSNVQEIKRAQVRTQQGQLNGPVWETAIGVKLKDPTPYKAQFNILIRKLIEVNTDMYDVDLWIRISSLGKDSEKAEALLMKRGQL